MRSGNVRCTNDAKGLDSDLFLDRVQLNEGQPFTISKGSWSRQYCWNSQ